MSNWYCKCKLAASIICVTCERWLRHLCMSTVSNVTVAAAADDDDDDEEEEEEEEEQEHIDTVG